MSSNIPVILRHVEVDENFLPYPATKFVITQYAKTSSDPPFWAWIVVGVFYDADDNAIWSSEVVLAHLDIELESDSENGEFSDGEVSASESASDLESSFEDDSPEASDNISDGQPTSSHRRASNSPTESSSDFSSSDDEDQYYSSRASYPNQPENLDGYPPFSHQPATPTGFPPAYFPPVHNHPPPDTYQQRSSAGNWDYTFDQYPSFQPPAQGYPPPIFARPVPGHWDPPYQPPAQGYPTPLFGGPVSGPWDPPIRAPAPEYRYPASIFEEPVPGHWEASFDPALGRWVHTWQFHH